MINSQELENGGLEIVNMDWVLGHMEAKFIGLPQGDARFDPSTGHPHSKGLWVMIATTTTVQCGTGLDHGGTSEFSSP